MPIQERADRVRVAPPSRLRTELNVVAAVVAVGIALLILVLLANTPAPRPYHRARPPAHAWPAAGRALARR